MVMATSGGMVADDGRRCASGLCVVVFVLQMIPGAARLRLDAEGFHVRSLYSGTTIRWSEVREFRVGNVGWQALWAADGRVSASRGKLLLRARSSDGEGRVGGRTCAP